MNEPVDCSLENAVAQLRKAIRFRDLSRLNCSASARKLCRQIMRRAALNSRAFFAGELVYHL